jgi:hypothetical protein
VRHWSNATTHCSIQHTTHLAWPLRSASHASKATSALSPLHELPLLLHATHCSGPAGQIRCQCCLVLSSQLLSQQILLLLLQVVLLQVVLLLLAQLLLLLSLLLLQQELQVLLLLLLLLLRLLGTRARHELLLLLLRVCGQRTLLRLLLCCLLRLLLHSLLCKALSSQCLLLCLLLRLLLSNLLHQPCKVHLLLRLLLCLLLLRLLQRVHALPLRCTPHLPLLRLALSQQHRQGVIRHPCCSCPCIHPTAWQPSTTSTLTSHACCCCLGSIEAHTSSRRPRPSSATHTARSSGSSRCQQLRQGVSCSARRGCASTTS